MTAAQVAFAQKVAFLRRPAAYPEDPAEVEAVQTHMSWVFLTASHAYKLKKPVHDPYRDLRQVEQRRHHAEDEVRLNRRLAGDVYLGTVPLYHGLQGLSLTEGDRVVDWLVRMRRLPAAASLEAVIRDGRADRAALRPVLERLAAFYREAPSAGFSGPGYRERFARDLRTERESLAGRVSGPTLERACAACEAFLCRRAALLEARAAAGRVVEGHGDLRPEHIYLTEPPVIIDCLEFSRELRLLDPADELAFLGLECERLGAPGPGRCLPELYREASGDRPDRVLFDFYGAFRALVRARLAAVHADDPAMDHGRHWRRRAEDYLQRAVDAAERALG